jgi:hypothetical protein
MGDRLVVGRFDDADEIKTTQHRILGDDLTTECSTSLLTSSTDRGFCALFAAIPGSAC